MHNKRLYKKLMTLLDWFIVILPLILLFGNILIFQFRSMNGSSLTSGDAISSLNGLFTWLNGTPLRNCFINLFKAILGVNILDFNIHPMLNFVVYYCCYIIIVVLIDMVRDLLLLIPAWFNNMLDK